MNVYFGGLSNDYINYSYIAGIKQCTCNMYGNFRGDLHFKMYFVRLELFFNCKCNDPCFFLGLW